ncbi:hypothetical protein HGRIS_011140 [Hohenbuehelia grisea]|uniref:Uncharacterized protein n=1 Tax=Hohenbuehelia grisea TaxID=104357 RepID=A0ABR3IZC9_9AGAR
MARGTARVSYWPIYGDSSHGLLIRESNQHTFAPKVTQQLLTMATLIHSTVQVRAHGTLLLRQNGLFQRSIVNRSASIRTLYSSVTTFKAFSRRPRVIYPAAVSRYQFQRLRYSTEPPMSDPPPPLTPEMVLGSMEAIAAAPWLDSVPPVLKDRMTSASALIMQVVFFLHQRPEAMTYLEAFEKADASPESEISRARHVVITYTRCIVRNLTSITDENFRAEHAGCLAVFGALVPAHDMYLLDLEKDENSGRYVVPIETWTPFWQRALPVLLELGIKLEEAGFGMTEEEAKIDS